MPYFYLICLIIIVQSNYTLNISEAQDNVKVAQLYLAGQFINSLNDINVTETQQREDVNFGYQLWYNANYTMAFYLMPYPGELIDTEQFRNQTFFPEENDEKKKFQTSIEEWKDQNDEDKSVILQSITYQIGQNILQDIPLCKQILNTNQAQLIQENNNNKKKNSPSYIAPIPWQHVQMSHQQYRLSRLMARAYHNEISIEQALAELPCEEQHEAYKAFCQFLDLPMQENDEQLNKCKEKVQPPNQVPDDPVPPSSSQKHRVFLGTMGVMYLMIFLYYVAQKIKTIRSGMEEKPKLQKLVLDVIST